MSKALAVDNVVRVSIFMSPKASARRNFGILMIAGSSPVIDQSERLRSYSGLDAVAADFGVNAPEYDAAQLFYSQTPRPVNLMIGRWVTEASPAVLRGGILTPDEQAVALWTAFDDVDLVVNIGGEESTIEGLDLSDATTLEGVAGSINTALAAKGANCTFDGERFILTTMATGAAALINYASGDLAEAMKLTTATALAPVGGSDGETPLQCTQALADRSGEWYGLAFADELTVDQHLDVAKYIEASTKSRIYGTTITDTRVMDAVFTNDLASKLKDLSLARTMVAYSSNRHAIVSAMARGFTVNFNANKSTITLKFKQLPGVVSEGLSQTQAKALMAKNCNVFAAYDNGSAIFQEGVMANGDFFDERHGLDWLQNAVQTEVWNLFYQSKSKVPQTDGGVNQVVTRLEKTLGEAVNNGLVAAGTWNGDSFGQLEQGDYLPKGFYVYAGLVDEQAQSEREQRKAPPIQVAAKLAGAIHYTDIQIDVNR